MGIFDSVYESVNTHLRVFTDSYSKSGSTYKGLKKSIKHCVGLSVVIGSWWMWPHSEAPSSQFCKLSLDWEQGLSFYISSLLPASFPFPACLSYVMDLGQKHVLKPLDIRWLMFVSVKGNVN